MGGGGCLGRSRQSRRTRRRLPPRNAKRRREVGSERLGRGGRVRGGGAGGRPRSLRLRSKAVGRRGPHASLRTGAAPRRPRRCLVSAELRRTAGARDQRGG